MFAELPKLFDRDFAIGYLLPAAFFAAINFWLAKIFHLLPGWLGKQVDAIVTSPNNAVTLTAIYSVVTFLLAILLLALNLPITRILEGYWKRYNPFSLIGGLERRRFQRMDTQKRELNRQAWEAANTPEGPLLNDRFGEISAQLMERFPDKPNLILSTAFGNTIRAFEVYSRIMYGFDAIPGWYRLLSVIPKEYQDLIDGAKAQMDFWMNVWFLSLIVVLEYGGMALFHANPDATGRFPYPFVPFVAAGIALLTSQMATYAAKEWGNHVKAAFDVFRLDLLKKLAFEVPAEIPEPMKKKPDYPQEAPENQQERAVWKAFSQALIVGRVDLMPPRHHEPPGVTKDSSQADKPPP